MAEPILIAPGQTLTVPDWDAVLLQHGNLLPNTQPQNIGIVDPIITGQLPARPTLAAHIQQHPAYRYTMADGSTVVAMGTGRGDEVEILEYKPSAKFSAAQTRATAAAAKADDEWHTEGTPLPDGTTDNARPIMARTVNGVKQTRQPTAKELEDWQLAGQMTRNPGGKTDKQIADEAEKAAAAAKAATAGTGSSTTSEVIGGKAYNKVKTVTQGPNGGTITEEHYEDPAAPGVKIPTPLAPPTGLGTKLGSVTKKDAQGNTTVTTSYLQPDGTTKEVVDSAQVPGERNPVRTDPQTGRRYETIYNPDGSVKEEREITQTGPGAQAAAQYTYPELKLAYGNISQELMAVSRDIYSRVGVGEGKITKEEADRLFKPIYDQAAMRVSELNSIADTQKSVWQSQMSTANTRLDAATRMAGQAFGLASQADKMAPGTGKVAGQMVWDMMHAQKDFASGMGGLSDPKMGGYLQAAVGMGPDNPTGAAPGLGVPAAPGLAPPPVGPGAAQGATAPPAPGVAATPTDPGMPWFTPTGAQGAPGVAGPDPAAAAAEAARQQAAAGAAPAPAAVPEPAAPQGYLNFAERPSLTSQAGGGVTINIGGQPQQGGVAMEQPPASSLASSNYLSPAANPQRPSLQSTQRNIAGGLLSAGFHEDIIEQLWQKNTGQSLLGQRRMAGAGMGRGLG